MDRQRRTRQPDRRGRADPCAHLGPLARRRARRHRKRAAAGRVAAVAPAERRHQCPQRRRQSRPWHALGCALRAEPGGLARHRRLVQPGDRSAWRRAMTRCLLMMPPHADDATVQAWARGVSAAAPGLRVRIAEDRAAALRLLTEGDAAYGTLDAELLAHAPKLAWLQAPMAAPPAGYFFPELVAHPVAVTNFRGIYNDHVATHAVAMLLALARGLPRYMRQQIRGDWVRHLVDEEVLHLPESTVLVVGVGGIGAEIGRMVSAFGARVIGVDPRRSDLPEGMQALFAPQELDRLLPTSDAVVLTLPHTPESEGLIDGARLALMPRHGLLVNIGRGATVRLDAVVEALRAER